MNEFVVSNIITVPRSYKYARFRRANLRGIERYFEELHELSYNSEKLRLENKQLCLELEITETGTKLRQP